MPSAEHSARPTVVAYTLDRLADLGIAHVFGVPGDYAFPVNDAVEVHPRLTWVPSANELNAAYAADGYARRRGAAILSTTYGVGELSALNGVMGAMAERVPVFHLVGAPSQRIIRQGLVCHHSLGDGVYGNFEALSAAACCVSARLTPENAVIELERVIDRALEESRPAYIVLPMDQALMPIGSPPLRGQPIGAVRQRQSVAQELEAALELVVARLAAAERAVLLPTATLRRYGLVPAFERLLAACGLPYATAPIDKGLLGEEHPAFLGTYNGGRSAPAALQALVEEADLILDVGGLVLEDLNTGLWSDSLDPARMISLRADWVQVGGPRAPRVFTGVALQDMLEGLAARLSPPPAGPRWGEARPLQPSPLLPLAGQPDDRLTSDLFYPRLQRVLRAGDLLVVDTGTCGLRINGLRLPAGVALESQTLWGSIGWATPASLGCALAGLDGRVVMVSGDGAHQLTVQELGVMGLMEVRPVLIVLNNGLYGIEAVISETGHAYNVLPPWRYARLPEAMGCRGWWSGTAATVAELEDALAAIAAHPGAAYLEVLIPPEESQPLPEAAIERLHQAHTPSAAADR